MSSARRAGILFAVCAMPGISGAQLRRAMPESLSDRAFWDFFVANSEEGGSFPSENFVSNEQTYQYIIPTLQQRVAPGTVYLGVGPEQNFTYIANLKPRMAVIFDIRRQNAMAHLMYKAMFELSPTRAQFIGWLFARTMPASLSASATPAELFAAATAAKMNDSVFDADRKAIVDHLTVTHGFALTPEDVRSINRVYSAFFEAGPEINYGYRPGSASSMFTPYITYARLQSLTNVAGINMAFLASEENYQTLRAMHMKNLIVPVVGNFSGPKAIRGVGEYLKQHGGTVGAFYLSNVEQYLFRQYDDAPRFYRNVETLPLDSSSTFIRSVPPNGDMFGGAVRFIQGAGGNANIATSSYSVSISDSAGLRVIRTTTVDSTGKSVTTSSIDTGTTRRATPLEIFRSLTARDDSIRRARSGFVFGRDSTTGGMRSLSVGGSLISGIAPIRATLDAFNANRLNLYQQAIEMTQTSGWIDEKKRP
jgi:hypothetical protein